MRLNERDILFTIFLLIETRVYTLGGARTRGEREVAVENRNKQT